MGKQKRHCAGPILEFVFDELRCALLLSVVERVVRSVAITPLPKAPEIVMGVINAQGRIIPVINVRNRFRLPERGISVDDRFIIANTSRRLVALAADSVIGVRQITNPEFVSVDRSLSFAEHIEGLGKTTDGLILIYDLDEFLSLDEERELKESLSEESK